MIIKTQGIVLHQTKYSETSLILDVVTPELGRHSFVISGVRKSNSRISPSMLRPAMMIDLVAYFKEGKTLHRIKELSPHMIYSRIPFDIVRGTGALFMVEVFRQVQSKLQHDEHLYGVLYTFLRGLDSEECDLKVILHEYIIALLEVLGLGIQPGESNEDIFFHVENGTFVSGEVQGITATLEESRLLAELQQKDIKNQNYEPLPDQDLYNIQHNPSPIAGEPKSKHPETEEAVSHRGNAMGEFLISGRKGFALKVRRGLLDKLILYMKWHIPGFKGLRSVAVLRDLWDTRGDEFVS